MYVQSKKNISELKRNYIMEYIVTNIKFKLIIITLHKNIFNVV